MLDVPNNQTLPVVRITIVLTGDVDRARYTLRDSGGDFKSDTFTASNGASREQTRSAVDAEAMRRMSHYCGLGHAVEPWSVPS